MQDQGQSRQSAGADCPSCFGDPEKCGAVSACLECEYVESCRYYCENPAPPRYGRDSKGHHVSMEAYGYAEEVAALPDAAAVPGQDEEEYNAPIYSNADMQRLLEFFLRGVDDYSLAIVECVLRENCASAAQVAKAFGVSREAIHRKIIDSCRQYPYLRDTLRCALYRCKMLADPENRAAIAGRRLRKVSAPGSNDKEQMEFSFNAES